MFTIHQAKSRFPRLIALALAGEEVIIARSGTPLVTITPLGAAKKTRTFGAFKGQFELTDAFFEPLPNGELARWNGEGD